METLNWDYIKQFDLILFDMDGTLVNTEPLHGRAIEVILKKNQLEIKDDVEVLMERFMGVTDSVVLMTLFPHLSENDVIQLIQEKNVVLQTIFNNLSPIEKNQLTSPGIIHFLKKLNEKKITTAVVSASEDIIVSTTLSAFDLHQYFSFSMGRGQTSRTKPHPDPYIEAMKRANINPHKTLIFEDSPTGLQSAKASMANVFPVAPFSKHQYLKNFLVN